MRAYDQRSTIEGWLCGGSFDPYAVVGYRLAAPQERTPVHVQVLLGPAGGAALRRLGSEGQPAAGIGLLKAASCHWAALCCT